MGPLQFVIPHIREAPTWDKWLLTLLRSHCACKVAQTKTDLRDLDTGASAFRDATVAREGSLDELVASLRARLAPTCLACAADSLAAEPACDREPWHLMEFDTTEVLHSGKLGRKVLLATLASCQTLLLMSKRSSLHVSCTAFRGGPGARCSSWLAPGTTAAKREPLTERHLFVRRRSAANRVPRQTPLTDLPLGSYRSDIRP